MTRDRGRETYPCGEEGHLFTSRRIRSDCPTRFFLSGVATTADLCRVLKDIPGDDQRRIQTEAVIKNASQEIKQVIAGRRVVDSGGNLGKLAFPEIESAGMGMLRADLNKVIVDVLVVRSLKNRYQAQVKLDNGSQLNEGAFVYICSSLTSQLLDYARPVQPRAIFRLAHWGPHSRSAIGRFNRLDQPFLKVVRQNTPKSVVPWYEDRTIVVASIMDVIRERQRGSKDHEV